MKYWVLLSCLLMCWEASAHRLSEALAYQPLHAEQWQLVDQQLLQEEERLHQAIIHSPEATRKAGNYFASDAFALLNQSLRNQEIQLQERNIYANYIAHLPKHEGTSYSLHYFKPSALHQFTEGNVLFDRGYFKGIGSLDQVHQLRLASTLSDKLRPAIFRIQSANGRPINYLFSHDHAIKIWQPNSLFLIQAADYDPHEAVYYFDIKEVTLQEALLHQDMIDFQSGIPSNLFQDLHYRCFS